MTPHNRETLLAALGRIPETDPFARMLLVGKIKSIDRATASSHKGTQNGSQ